MIVDQKQRQEVALALTKLALSEALLSQESPDERLRISSYQRILLDDCQLEVVFTDTDGVRWETKRYDSKIDVLVYDRLSNDWRIKGIMLGLSLDSGRLMITTYENQAFNILGTVNDRLRDLVTRAKLAGWIEGKVEL